MKISLAAVVVAATVLSGCYTAYQGPASGPTAELRVIRNSGYLHGAQTYKVAETCSDRVILMPPNDPTSEKRFALAAGKEFSYTFDIQLSIKGAYHGVEFRGCAPTATFVPVAGEIYETWPEVQGNACLIQLKRVDGPNRAPVPFKEREWQRPYSDSGSFCKS